MEMLALSKEDFIHGQKCKAIYILTALLNGESDLAIGLGYIPIENKMPKNRYSENKYTEYFEDYERAYRTAICYREELGCVHTT
jgi:hypothetical protein